MIVSAAATATAILGLAAEPITVSATPHIQAILAGIVFVEAAATVIVLRVAATTATAAAVAAIAVVAVLVISAGTEQEKA